MIPEYNVSSGAGTCATTTFLLSTNKNCSVICSASLYSRSWHVRILPIRPCRKHVTTAAAGIGGATSTPAVVTLLCVVEFGYEYTYYFVGSSAYLGMREPGTWYQVHFSHKYFILGRKTTITQQDQAEAEDAEDSSSTRENVCVLFSSSTYT